MAQFLWLNGIWALTIVLFEVPSGVLADILGRKKLVVFSAMSMAVEMLLLIVAPQNAGWGLFAICAINRVLSGMAEAAASGADEALAYDSLKILGKEGDSAKLVESRWDNTLLSTMRWQSFVGIVAMLVGGLVYDHERMIAMFGQFPQIISMKLPIILCFISALVCIGMALRLTDPGFEIEDKKSRAHPSAASLGKGIFDACKWVAQTPWIAAVLIGAILIDATSRTFVTLISEYMRWINLPEYSFGIMGAGMSLCGWFVPLYVKALAQKFSPNTNMLIAGGIATVGLLGVSYFDGIIGITACFINMMALIHIGFLLSRYFNSAAPSKQRASILSVKSLALNLGYGIFSGIFALRLKNADFGEAMPFMPLFLVTGLTLWFVSTTITGAKKA